MRLYELPSAFAEIESLSDENGELPPDAFERLNALECELETKAENICRVVRNYEARAAAFKAEADRLTNHRTVAENNVKRLKEYLKQTLDTLGIKKLEAGLFCPRIQANPLAVSVADTVDAEKLPPEFRVVEYSADKKALLKASKEGRKLPEGITVSQGSHLRIV